MRKRLRAGNILDVEAILEADEVKLAEIVGDRATAAKLRDMAKAVLANAKVPLAGGTVTPKSKSTPKKPRSKKT